MHLDPDGMVYPELHLVDMRLAAEEERLVENLLAAVVVGRSAEHLQQDWGYNSVQEIEVDSKEESACFVENTEEEDLLLAAAEGSSPAIVR